MKNLNDLNRLLFDQLERLSVPGLKGDELMDEIQRTEAVTKVSGQIIGNANTLLKALQLKENAMDANMQLPELIVGIVSEDDKNNLKR